MNAETIMYLIIMSMVALIMILIGVCQITKKDAPVGFYNLIEPPKKEEISDVLEWNKQHGRIWLIYGICIELGCWLGYIVPIEALEIFFAMGGVVIPLPFMIIRHHSLTKIYKK